MVEMTSFDGLRANGFKDVDSRFLGNDGLKKERKKMRS